MKKRLIVGNWKSYLNYTVLQEQLSNQIDDCIDFMQKNTSNCLVLCPSFESIALLRAYLKNSPIELGAQDCSAYSAGAHTGDVSAQSLASLGCTYCIIGHSERQRDYQEKVALIIKKAFQTLAHNITPIICFGQLQENVGQSQLAEIIKNQLEPLFGALENNPATTSFLLAYEPVWAIGSGKTPSIDEIARVCKIVQTIAKDYKIANSYHILYGGSVDGTTINALKAAPIDGFLIGKASTDFQELKKIVSCL